MKKTIANLLEIISISLSDCKKTILASCILFFLFSIVSSLIQPIIIRWTFDAIEEGIVEKMIINIIIAISIIVLNGILLYFLLVYMDTWADYIIQTTNISLIKRLIAIPYGGLKARFENGDLVNRISKAANTIFSFILLPGKLLSSILICWCFVVLLKTFDYKIWLIVFGVFFIIVILSKIQCEFEKKLAMEMEKSFSEKQVITRELIGNYNFFAMNSLDNYIKSRYISQREEMFRIAYKQTICTSIFDALHDLVCFVGKTGIISMIYPLRVNSSISAGEISSFPYIYDGIMSHLLGIRKIVTSVPHLFVPVNRYFDVISFSKSDKKAYKKNVELICALDGVNLIIDNSEIINNISLKIYNGEKIAIIGKNGSGKSTLLRIILGMYNDDVSGQILFSNEVDENVAFVPVRHQFFKGTTIDNVLSGVSDNEPLNKVKLQLYDESNISDILWQQVDNLSEGQKQYANIYRAVIKHSDLIVGDEITASLDKDKRKAILEKILTQFNTVICVVHDLELLNNFDRIIIMKDGMIVDDNNYNEIKKSQNYIDLNKWSEN